MNTVLHGEFGQPVVELHGELEFGDAEGLRSLLLGLWQDGPDYLVCDLNGLTFIDSLCMAVFSATPAWGHWPGPVLALCGAHGQVADQLDAFGMSKFVPVYDTVEQASAGGPPAPGPRLRARLPLRQHPTAAGHARRFVRLMCSQWGLGLAPLVADAELVASELVTNVLQHARTFAELRLELHEHALQIAVHDFDPSPPKLRSVQPESEHGRGLALVTALSMAWNSQMHPSGGKVVWAALARPPAVP